MFNPTHIEGCDNRVLRCTDNNGFVYKLCRLLFGNMHYAEIGNKIQLGLSTA